MKKNKISSIEEEKIEKYRGIARQIQQILNENEMEMTVEHLIRVIPKK